MEHRLQEEEEVRLVLRSGMRHLNVRWNQNWWLVRLNGTLECLPLHSEHRGRPSISLESPLAGARVGQQHPLLASLSNLS